MDGSRLRAARKALSLSADKLGELLGVSGATVSRWEQCVHEPGDDMKIKLSKILNISIAYLMGEDNSEIDSLSTANDMIELPIYEMAAVVQHEMECAPSLSIKEVEMIFIPKSAFLVIDETKPPFAVIMPNDSMRGADILTGDIVVVNPSEVAQNGEPAFAIYNSAGLVRWVCYKADGSIELQAANPDHNSITIEPEYIGDICKFKVIGRIVAILSRKTPKNAF